LKKHLTLEKYNILKKRTTPHGGNIQLCIKSGIEDATDPIGVLATDEEAYRTYEDMFGPVIRDLHP
jgi:arginine kinase